MNIEETKKAIEVMQAFVDGKEVQARKPEPKNIWVNEYKDGWVVAYNSQALASAYAGDCVVRKAVHYREVVE